MDENERYLVAVHDLEDALNRDLHNSVVGHNQNENLTDEHINNILDDLRSATERFTTNTELSGKYAAVDRKSLQSCGSRRSEARDTVSSEFMPVTLRQEPDKYHNIYPTLSPVSSQTEADDGHPVRPDTELKMRSTVSKLNRIRQQQNRMLALERIEASIKNNMRRL